MLRTMLLATAASAAMAAATFAQTPAPTPPAQRPAPPSTPPQGESTTVQGVTVTAQRSDVRTSIDRLSYNVANDLQATSGSVADALRNVPSVEVDVQGNVSLRGDSNVRILIDGRPSGMFEGQGRADALQQMSADQLERVEVITNPGAAFSAEGSGGVINLVTRRNRRAGRFATVRANVGTDGRVNGGISGAYNSERLTVSGDVGLRLDSGNNDVTLDRERLVGNTIIESRQRSDGEAQPHGGNARLSVEYNVNPQNRVNAQARYNFGIFESENSETFEEDNAAGALARAFNRQAFGENRFTNAEVTAGWRRTFTGDEHELVADVTLGRTTFERELDATVVDLLPVAGTRGEDIRNSFDQDLARIKIDYNRPLAEGARLRVGYEGESFSNDYDNRGGLGAGSGPFPPNPNLTNQFLYEQTINAFYATYQRPFGRLTAQGGLRVEQVSLDFSSVTQNTQNTQDDTSLYPSLHLAYELTDQQQLTASYSLRVQRPSPQDLNPFVFYLDPFNLRAGNPDLEPQETHSYELGWRYRSGPSTYLATLYHRVSDNGVTDIVEDLGDGVFLTTRANLAERRLTGLELVANGRFSPEWTYNVSGNAFHEEISASTFGFTERSGTSFSVRGSLNWQPTPNDFIQLQGFYNGRRLQPQGYREPFAVLSIGYRRKVNDQLSLVATLRDVFDSLKDELVIETPEFRDRIERRFAGRALFVGFTYNFGQTPPQRREPGFDFEAPSGG